MEAKGIDVVTLYGLETALLGRPAVAEPEVIRPGRRVAGRSDFRIPSAQLWLHSIRQILGKEKDSDRRAEETHSAHSVDMV